MRFRREAHRRPFVGLPDANENCYHPHSHQ
jgi:hypothetical protein